MLESFLVKVLYLPLIQYVLGIVYAFFFFQEIAFDFFEF